MNKSSATINELAKAIVLDDVTDVFYRSLVYPFFERCELDDKSSLEQVMDTKVAVKLARQLNWTASLTSLDTVTHKFSHFLELVYSNALTANKLNALFEDNYWLKPALSNATQSLGLPTNFDEVSLNLESGEQVEELMLQTCWHYFSNQMSQPNQEILLHISAITTLFVEKAKVMAKTQGLDIDNQSFFHLALFNAYPMVVLLRLYDKCLQSSKQDMLNVIGMENQVERQNVIGYQPNADVLLSFLTFDEFVKPHVLDSLSLESALSSNLINGDECLDLPAKAFLQARTEVIRDMLNRKMVLTPAQMGTYKDQLGIKFEFHQIDNLAPKHSRMLSKIMRMEANP